MNTQRITRIKSLIPTTFHTNIRYINMLLMRAKSVNSRSIHSGMVYVIYNRMIRKIKFICFTDYDLVKNIITLSQYGYDYLQIKVPKHFTKNMIIKTIDRGLYIRKNINYKCELITINEFEV